MLEAIDIIDRYYNNHRVAREILINHGKLVSDKAMSIASRNPLLGADKSNLEMGAMLHDIGIFLTHAPGIGCYGLHPYICHGYLGRELLETVGLNQIAPVAERHTGAGLSLEEIKKGNLPLPWRDMLPVTIEEQIVCFADKFFSKGDKSRGEIPLWKVRESIERHGIEQLRRFNKLCEYFLS